MGYIFVDESGDLGFDFEKKRTSKHFIISFLFSTSPRPLQKAVKRTFKSMPDRHRMNHSGVLHATKENPRVRTKLLKAIGESEEVTILSIYLNKSRVYTRLQDEKQVLYNYVTNILLDRIFSKKLLPTNQRIVLVASQRETNRFLNDNFKSYLNSQVKSNHSLDINIVIKTPAEEKALQAADFVSWALFRNQEIGDDSYYNLIKGRIIEESPLFP
jgi:hypothetical protein